MAMAQLAKKLAGLLAGVAALLICFGLSVALGKSPVPLYAVWDAVAAFESGNRDHLIVQTVRIPRALIAMTVGACLAMAGALMQAVTRNALAGPELFGVNQGASLLIVIHIYWFGGASLQGTIVPALIGAATAGLLVYALCTFGGRGMTPLTLVLAGSAINLLLGALTQGILVWDEESLDTMRFWMAGSLTGRSVEMLWQLLPLMAVGAAVALLIGRAMNLIGLGDEAAQSLGVRVAYVKAAALAAVVLLAGASVALAGPISFIGLAVPHIARFLVGSDYRWVIPYSAVLGAVLLTLADVASRFVLPSEEISAGVMTALLGAPFLIYLSQRKV
ncbi:MAG: iron transporter, permease protein [Paenibacillus sp.]|nr:iron transporter, permease protein [Paenibacillus sp.]